MSTHNSTWSDPFGQVFAGQNTPSGYPSGDRGSTPPDKANHRSNSIKPREAVFERSDDTASLRDSARGTWSTVARPSVVRGIQRRTGRTVDQVFGSHWGVFTANVARAGVQLSDADMLAAWETYVQAMVNGEIPRSEFLTLVRRSA